MRRSLADLAGGVSTNALLEEAVAAQRAGRWEDAVMRFEAVLERLRASPRHDPEIAAGALYLKAACLYQQGYFRATAAACDALIARYAASNDPVTVGFVADTLWIQGRALAGCGETERGRAVLRRLIAEFGDQPQARSQVARAMYAEGMYLRHSGRRDEAIQVWDELFSRFEAHLPSRASSGQVARSQLLAEIFRLNEVQATSEDTLRRVLRDGISNRDERTAAVRPMTRRRTALAFRARRLSHRLRASLRRE